MGDKKQKFLRGFRMTFSNDFLKIFRFVIGIIRLIIETFGDDDDANELNNGKQTSL